jgi:hypothetical protein
MMPKLITRTAAGLPATGIAAPPLIATPASAGVQPEPTSAASQGCGHPAGWWGVGYPGTDQASGEYNHPNYDPRCQVADIGQLPHRGQESGLDTTFGRPRCAGRDRPRRRRTRHHPGRPAAPRPHRTARCLTGLED